MKSSEFVDNLDSKKSLNRKLQVLDDNMNDKSDIILNTPDQIVKQRIRELETMELDLRNEILDLEHDRAKLENMLSTNKTIAHEQSVELCGLRLTNTNLQQQVRSLEEQVISLQANAI